MQKVLLDNITLENVIDCKDNFFKIGFSSDMNTYIMAVLVTWIAWYDRYYVITEEDYQLFQTDKKAFLDKYDKELCQTGDCFTEHFIGSQALQDYDGANDFHHAYETLDNQNPFRGYLYYNGILYARIMWETGEIYVPPVQAIRVSEQEYRFPLRESCCMVKDKTGKPICYRLDDKSRF